VLFWILEMLVFFVIGFIRFRSSALMIIVNRV
jgi:hypothetical protein